ncbi:hypothetical protein [Kribbella sp. NPDC050459]|uniref:hypothetical protein n=1 Tax=Kribbella sp. NPDC050459 TaxID=3155785 RepID=UPI0033D97BD1
MARLVTLPLSRTVRLQKVLSRAVPPALALATSRWFRSARRVRRAMARLMVPPLRLLRTMRLTALLPRATLPRATRPRMIRPGVVLPRVTRLKVTRPKVTRLREVLVRGTGPKGLRATVLRGGMSLS